MLLLLAGPVTAIPLLLFAAAAQRLPLVTLGLLFYLNPGAADGLGRAGRARADAVGRWLGFALIWVALAVFTVDALRGKPAQSSVDVDLAAPESSYTVTSSID